MAPARQARYDDVEQLAVALTAGMAPAYRSTSSDATEIDAATEGARPPRRQKPRRLLGGAALAPLVVLSVWLASSEPPPRRTGSPALPSEATTREADRKVAPPLPSVSLPEPNPGVVPPMVSETVEKITRDVTGKALAPLRVRAADGGAPPAPLRRPSKVPSSKEEPAPVDPSSAVEGRDDPLIRRGYLVESPYASGTEVELAAKGREAE
jgi:hypothetical protein